MGLIPDKLKLLWWLMKLRKVDMSKMKSRKFWITIITGILTVFWENLGLPKDLLNYLIPLIASWVLGQSYVDGKKGGE